MHCFKLSKLTQQRKLLIKLISKNLKGFSACVCKRPRRLDCIKPSTIWLTNSVEWSSSDPIVQRWEKLQFSWELTSLTRLSMCSMSFYSMWMQIRRLETLRRRCLTVSNNRLLSCISSTRTNTVSKSSDLGSAKLHKASPRTYKGSMLTNDWQKPSKQDYARSCLHFAWSRSKLLMKGNRLSMMKFTRHQHTWMTQLSVSTWQKFQIRSMSSMKRQRRRLPTSKISWRRWVRKRAKCLQTRIEKKAWISSKTHFRLKLNKILNLA